MLKYTSIPLYVDSEGHATIVTDRLKLFDTEKKAKQFERDDISRRNALAKAITSNDILDYNEIGFDEINGFSRTTIEDATEYWIMEIEA